MARVYDIISRLENGNQKPVVKIDAERGLLLLKGAIPGAKGGRVVVMGK